MLWDSDTILISVDIETMGHIPEQNSMVALGAVAYNSYGEICGDFYTNIKQRPNTIVDPSVESFWKSNHEAYAMLQLNQVSCDRAMESFANWLFLSKFKKYVFMGYNVAYDIAFLRLYSHMYLEKYDSQKKLHLIPIELRAYMLGKLDITWEMTSKKNWHSLPFAFLLNQKSKLSKKVHHTALYDAELQGSVFWWLVNEAK